MPLSLPAMNAAIVCDGKELETYDVKQESTSSMTGFIASEAGKQFKITVSNNLSNSGFSLRVFVDGRRVEKVFLKAGSSEECLGVQKSSSSILPFKFQELQLVDPDLEDAPAAPEMGTIELQVYRCQKVGIKKRSKWQYKHEDLHWGRISERSKKAGWHHVATGDEIPVKRVHKILSDYLDSEDGPPYASIKIFYRPRELLRAQGIIPLNDVGNPGSPIRNKKRAREEDGSPGPSRSHPKITVKSEGLSGDLATQRIEALQAELDVLKASVQSGTFIKREVKHELRSPSPIVVKYSGELVDLTLDD
ncbi:hypothetical protein V8E53_012103 [Lactarius tabidus]